MGKEVPFGQSRGLSIEITEGDICKSDVFIDDIIAVGVDKDDYLDRIIAAPCSIMHAVAHNAEPNLSSIERQNIIANDKNGAEGAPEEVNIILGWQIDCRKMTASLPSHKFKAWSSKVSSFFNRKTASAEELCSILGQLENIAIIILMFGHCLNNI